MVSRGMSDRMSAIEALSTVQPVEAHNSGVYSGDSFADLRRPGATPLRIGIISATLTGLAVAVVHFALRDPTPESRIAKEHAPTRVVHAATFNEATPAVEPRTAEPQVVRDRARRLALMGRRAMDQGRPATARRMFERALEEYPQCRIALEGLGRDAMDHERYGDAAEYFRAAVKVDPRNADNHRLLADAYAAEGSTDRARSQYERAASLGDATAAKRLAELPPPPVVEGS